MLENYSKPVQTALKKVKINVGDKISIKNGNELYEGLLMPRTELGDKDSIVVKLSSGYNIGVKYDKNMKITKLASKQDSKIELEKPKFDPKKPNVTIISTGGTIASKVEYKTGGVKAIENPQELLFNVPELKEIANIKFVKVLQKMSEDMDSIDWQDIAKAVVKELTLGNAVVITHGTDTMHYTAAALSFMLKDLHKPVIITGSQRSPDRGSSDAGMNLICAVHAALSDIGEVGVVMHGSTDDDYCNFNRGTRVRKMHSSRRDTFRTLGDTPIAQIYPDGKINILSSYRKKKDIKVSADTKFENKITLVKVYPGSDPDILNYYLKKGYKGIVIEGTGFGYVPTHARKSWIPTVKKISKKIPIVIVTQTLFGRVNSNVYEPLRILYHQTDAINGNDMLPEVALVKLGHILGHTKKLKEIKKLMTKNLVGEISERSTISD
ncbi:MAG: Glu-tRNA(Gln) amidotransferase subunit GatD [Nanoarchaeota archaeon]|nr:Glu-tRNA(Gln) amidotransferase subunit GatD [Nanoarchaeota archaeon]MBU4124121.1 Glu-tRNA(Gln) amidotransferase subunit GatD [Nanoarchaeota archaeon]